MKSGIKGLVKLFQVRGLDRAGYRDLLSRLGLVARADPDEFWRLTAGNPAEAVAVATRYRGDVEFRKRALSARLRSIVRAIKRRGLMNYLHKSLEDLDGSPESLLKLLQAHDIITRVDFPVLGYEDEVHEARWDWQLPVYREPIASMVNGGV